MNNEDRVVLWLGSALDWGQGRRFRPVNPTDKAPRFFLPELLFSGFCFACLDGEAKVGAKYTAGRH